MCVWWCDILLIGQVDDVDVWDGVCHDVCVYVTLCVCACCVDVCVLCEI